MLRLSKLSDYATLILTYLASASSQVVSANSIAKTCHLSHPTVSKLLKIMAEAKLVTAFRGTGGGYLLARDIKEISIADIVIAIEGKFAITECCISTQCSVDAWCTVKENWKHINKIILNTLAEIKLSDMIRPLHMRPIKADQIP
jgi:FeS assembly SUF system regulator